MNESGHVGPLLADYVLGLVGHEQRRQIETHLGQCNACRRLWAEELTVRTLVRKTVAAVDIQPAHLRSLRPPHPGHPPAPAAFLGSRAEWLRPLASAALLLILILTGIGTRASIGSLNWPQPDSTAAAVVSTEVQLAALAVDTAPAPMSGEGPVTSLIATLPPPARTEQAPTPGPTVAPLASSGVAAQEDQSSNP